MLTIHRFSRRAASLTGAWLAGLVLAASHAGATLAQDIPFTAWRDGFASDLRSEGVRADIVASMLDGLEPDPTVIERDQTQPEFVRPIWQYLEGAVSETRVANGRRASARIAETLQAVEERFEVDQHILTGIWGLESAYGEIQGNFDIVRSLATLAWEGRRRGFAEAQLRAIAQMLDRGYATRAELIGSWAGGMGQTQFIPATYMERAVDFNGDGRRDIWRNEGDALGSAANLLARAGWEYRQPVFTEVRLPEGFSFADWNESQRRQVSQWAGLGIEPVSGGWEADDLNRPARLVIPAGANAPAFLVYRNFEALLRYNNSTAYALGVAYLARAFEHGDAGMATGWPVDNPPINRTQSRELQEALARLGYDPGGLDGVVGPNTRRAIRAFQSANGFEPDGYAGLALYNAVMAADAAR